MGVRYSHGCRLRNPKDIEKQRADHNRFRNKVGLRVNALINTLQYTNLREKIGESEIITENILEDIVYKLSFTETGFAAEELIGKAEEAILKIPTLYGMVIGISSLAYAEYEAGFIERAKLDFALAREIATIQPYDGKEEELYSVIAGLSVVMEFMVMCGLDVTELNNSIVELKKRDRIFDKFFNSLNAVICDSLTISEKENNGLKTNDCD